MPGVIFRHLWGEAARTWLVITAVLVLLTLGIGLSRYIGDAAAGAIPVDTVASLAALSVVGHLQIVLPFSILLAVMLVVGRLCRDNEMAALMAGGAGLGRIYRPFLALAVMVALFAGFMSIYAAPRAQQATNRLAAQTAAHALQSVTPGRFVSFDHDRIAFYAGSRDAQGHLHDIFIRALSNGGDAPRQVVITAKTARESVDAHDAATLILTDGWRYEGVPGRADYRIIRFQTHGVQISPPKTSGSTDIEATPTAALIGRDAPRAVSAWQTRVSVPLSILLLALVALPIGRVPPRAGRYGRVVVGILFYVIYLNLVRLSGKAIESGLLPAAIGEWWVHAAVLVLGVALMLREAGLLRRPRRPAA